MWPPVSPQRTTYQKLCKMLAQSDRRSIVFFSVAIMAVVGTLGMIVYLSHRQSVEINRIFEDHLPLTPTSFEAILAILLQAGNSHSRYLRNCQYVYPKAATLSDENTHRDGLPFVGDIHVLRSFPVTWMKVYADANISQLCYYIHSINHHSTPMCATRGHLDAFVEELAAICTKYTINLYID